MLLKGPRFQIGAVDCTRAYLREHVHTRIHTCMRVHTSARARTHTRAQARACNMGRSFLDYFDDCTKSLLLALSVTTSHATASRPNYVGHNYVGHNYTGHNYVGHNYIGHNCIGHNYIGHNYTGHNYVGHNYVGHYYTGHNYIPSDRSLGVRRRRAPKNRKRILIQTHVSAPLLLKLM